MPMRRRRKGEKKSAQAVRSAMTEMKAGTLHSGSKHGPKVTDPKQAVAIGLSQARKSKNLGVKSKAEPKKDLGKAEKAMTKAAHRRKRSIGRS